MTIMNQTVNGNVINIDNISVAEFEQLQQLLNGQKDVKREIKEAGDNLINYLKSHDNASAQKTAAEMIKNIGVSVLETIFGECAVDILKKIAGMQSHCT